jgi:hypothetical protein
LPGPTLVIVAWLEPGWASQRRLRKLLLAELERTPTTQPDSVSLLSNSDLAMGARLARSLHVAEVGPAALAAVLDSDAELRRGKGRRYMGVLSWTFVALLALCGLWFVLLAIAAATGSISGLRSGRFSSHGGVDLSPERR